MPPSWPSRLLSGSGAHSSADNNNTASSSQVNDLVFDGTSQSGHTDALPGPTSPTRTRFAPRQHAHNRSSSHPLPRIFGRKKSSGLLRGQVDLEAPPDDSLVPVLDAPLTASPTRGTFGKKKLDDEPSIVRLCMCCSTKCRFPRGLMIFRCTNCLTINDLEPFVPQEKESKVNTNGDTRSEPRATFSLGPKPVLPLSVERTKAIITQCLTVYLEERCKREESSNPMPPTSSPTRISSNLPQRSSSRYIPNSRVPLSPTSKPARADSPPSHARPNLVERAPSATIRSCSDFTDFGFAEDPSSPPRSISQPTVPTIHHPRPPLGIIAGKPVPSSSVRRQPPPAPLRIGTHSATGPYASRPRTDRHVTPPTNVAPAGPSTSPIHARIDEFEHYDRAKKILKPLEDYLMDSYGRFDCLNVSFTNGPARRKGRTHSESAIQTPPPESMGETPHSPFDYSAQVDAKTLLLGDIAENGDWWTGRLERNYSERVDQRGEGFGKKKGMVSSRSPMIDWEKLSRWYGVVHCAGQTWWDTIEYLEDHSKVVGVESNLKGPRNTREIDADLATAREHAERALLKITENLLRRPGRPLQNPDDIRFLLLVLSNPSLYPSSVRSKGRSDSARPNLDRAPSSMPRSTHEHLKKAESPSKGPPREQSQHTGILKRAFGLLANSSDSCHRYMIGWFSRMPDDRFIDLLDLVASFITYRLSRRRVRPRTTGTAHDGGLIPDLSGSAMYTSAQLQAATGLSGGSKKRDEDGVQTVAEYSEDWQLRAAAKVMALMFAANNVWHKKDVSLLQEAAGLTRPRAKAHGQLLPTSDFYNTLLDYTDLIADFKAWESKKAKFTFCQYPFLLSVGSKIRILEYDARRQMENKAREAYFDNVTSGKFADVNLNLTVRRECVVEDSLRLISEAVGSGQEELKKGLRVKFAGEEGIDAGGLRKEWFLMLVRDIFDPNHGMFLYDEDSQTCYFNPNSFETSDQYYLVGILLGLAIYNSTILDVALPPFAFRKLLASAPASASTTSSIAFGARGSMTYTVDDLAEYRPALAAGLRQLLEFDGDVESTFCRDFVAPVERFGTITNIPLCPGGEKKAVTNANRTEFVDLYVRYLLDVAIARQFEPFKRGFFTVCAGNALSLFRAEEIELLIRGSDEAVDVDSLAAVAVYENWRDDAGQLLAKPAESVPVIGWFWQFFKAASPVEQRALLAFVTSSDRIPAAGAANLVLRIAGGGDGTGKPEREAGASDRFPIARTCFNMLILWRYESCEKMGARIRMAVAESEGFGLK